jgi:hypothetical protein
MLVDEPADPVWNPDCGVALDKFAVRVTFAFNAPPPLRPVPAMTWVVVGTYPEIVAGIDVAAITRPVESTVKTGMSVAVPYVPGVTPLEASCDEPTPPFAMLRVTLPVS